MPFKPSLVALESDPPGFPYLGFPVTEIVLEQPNGVEGAAIPAIPSPDIRDKITESVTGSDVRVNRRKLTDIDLEIDFIDADKKSEIERLYHDSRTVYLSPNFGPDTLFSIPFQRSERDITGSRTFGSVRSGVAYRWDDIDKVFRSWDTGEPPIPFHGAWARYKAGDFGHTNYATDPHPDSGGTGWTLSAGSGSVAYSEDVLSPVLSKRGVTNGKGVTIVSGALQAPVIQARHTSASSLSATNTLIASVCFACHGAYSVSLTNTAGTVNFDTVTGTGDGTFQLIKLSGANTTGVTQADIRISFIDNYQTDVLAMIGPVYIASETSAISLPRVCDWVESSHGVDQVISSDGIELILPEMTISCLVKFAEDQYTAICQLGGMATGCHVLFSDPNMRIVQQNIAYYWTDMNEYNLTEGEWYHLVITGSNDGVNLYVNGVGHSDNGTHPWFPVKETTAIEIGKYGSYVLSNSGLSHFRLDRRAWTEQEIIDHHDTFLSGHGRGIIEPTYGKEMYIADMEWSARTGSGDPQWLGNIVLRELGPLEYFATMQRQEDM